MKKWLFAAMFGMGLLSISSPAMASTTTTPAAPVQSISSTATGVTTSAEPEWPDWFDATPPAVSPLQ